MAKKFVPKLERNKKFMECDICERYDCKDILVLKPNGFSKKATPLERNAKRVCWRCAENLFFKKKYNFSHIWRLIFFRNSFNSWTLETEKEKYMVIHE